MNSFDVLRPSDAALLRETLARVAPELIEPLQRAKPDMDLRDRVIEALADEFSTHVDPDADWESDAEGLAVERLLDDFLLAFPA